ncbi:MAG: hypothetical protein J07HB67_01644, partial [halophilic archaeon J07HB67]
MIVRENARRDGSGFVAGHGSLAALVVVTALVTAGVAGGVGVAVAAGPPEPPHRVFGVVSDQ